jgi:ADP-heptose:LPS heptosyltransferase
VRTLDLQPIGVQSLLAVELTRLGDLISALPAIRSLRSHFSKARVHVLVDERYASLLRGLLADVGVHGFHKSASPRQFLSALRTVRQLRADIVCSMSPARRNVFLTLGSGARYKAGYLTSVRTVTPYRTSSVVQGIDRRRSHDVKFEMENIGERALKVCDALDVPREGPAWVPGLLPSIAGPIRDRLVKDATYPRFPYIVVHPFAGWKYRTWALEKFHNLVRSMLGELPCDVCFICSDQEAGHLEDTRELFRAEPRVHFFPSKDLLTTAVLVEGASLFVGSDSGPLHLAAALDRKSVV